MRKYKTWREHSAYETQGSDSPDAPHWVDYSFKLEGVDDKVISQGNPVHKLGASADAIGGDFLVIRNIVNQEKYLANQSVISGGAWWIPSAALYYHGGAHFAVGNIGVNDWPDPIIPTNGDLDAAGTNAIASVLPTNPVSGLVVALGELKSEGIPTLPGIQSWRGRTFRAKQAGNEYLNHQFGWLPLVSDIRSFSHAVSHSDEIIKQYDRQSGTKIKRTYDFPVERDIVDRQEEVGSGFIHVTPDPPLDVRYYIGSNGTSRRTVTRSIERRRWFEGSFTYYIPPYKPNGDNTVRNAQLAAKLYGVEVTPEVIWNLTPWTWAADWVGNFGRVFHNLSAFAQDGLVMNYGYVMETTIHKVEVMITGVEFRSNPGVSHTLTTSLSTVVKMRRKATPFGFGLDTDGFTLRQLSILGALGISRR